MKTGGTNECISTVIAETKMPTQSSSSSPVDMVLSVDDLLTEILLRLPVRCLLRLKSVSKHWHSLITSPSFSLLRSRNPDPPSGLFVPVENNTPYQGCEFLSFDNESPPIRTINFDLNAPTTVIEHSSNGLILCTSYHYDKARRRVVPYKYYVYNPTINQYITLPRVQNYKNLGRSGMTIAFDPSKSSDYRIIYVFPLGKDCPAEEINYQIEIFSSTTRTWKHSCQFPGNREFDLHIKGGVYWNNAIHWVQFVGYILYFNLDEESIHEKQTPLRLLGLYTSTSYIFESQDQLLLVELEIGSPNTKFIIHELKRDYSEWSIKYHVDLQEVSGSFPEIRYPELPSKFQFVVMSIVFGEKEDDSFLVLEIPGKALRLNLATNTFHKLYDFPASRYIVPKYVWSCNQYVYPFVESLYCL